MPPTDSKPADSKPVPQPSSALRAGMNLWLVVHLGLLAMSLAGLLVASPVQGRLVRFALPYLSPLHMRVDNRPLDFLNFTESDWEHRLEWGPVPADEVGGEPVWRLFETAKWGRFAEERLSRLARAVSEAAEVDDTATAALLIKPWIDRLVSDPAVAAAVGQHFQVRVVVMPRQPAGESSPEVRLRAAVILTPDASASAQRSWKLVTLDESRLNATPVAPRVQ
ncbi:hypothetical protein SH139x_004453 [Planctomycetaceae bacterium SH139]